MISLKDSEGSPLWVNVSKIFIKSFDPAQIKIELDKKNLLNVASFCHKYKSGCFNVGLVEFYNSLNRVEELIVLEKSSNFEEIEKILNPVFFNYQEAISEIESKIKDLESKF